MGCRAAARLRGVTREGKPALGLGTRVRIGVSGWTYAPWRGVLYPKGLAQKRELEYAALRFRSVEFNGTFYGMHRNVRASKYVRALIGRVTRVLSR